MFQLLAEKLQAVFQKLAGKGVLTENDVDEGLRQVRLALLEADVHFRVAKDFIDRVREKAVGAEVMKSLSPGHQVVKIVHEELVSLLGDGVSRLNPAPHPPSVIMLVGLFGSGKTTTAAKLAFNFKKEGQQPLLVAADLHRPAAVAQLTTLANQLKVPIYQEKSTDPLAVAVNGLKRGRE